MVEAEKIREVEAEAEAIGTPDQFVGRDLLESFIYWLNYISSNPLEHYNVLVKGITFGMALLPCYDDFSETDPDRIKENKENQDRIDKLYNDAENVLKNEVPAKREITWESVDAIGGEPVALYQIKAVEDKDAKICHAIREELSIVLNNFITQQHESHIPQLQLIHNRILRELTLTGIVPAIAPSLENLVKEEIKILHRELVEIPEEGVE